MAKRAQHLVDDEVDDDELLLTCDVIEHLLDASGKQACNGALGVVRAALIAALERREIDTVRSDAGESAD